MDTYGTFVIMLAINLPSVQYTRTKELVVFKVYNVSKKDAEKRTIEFINVNQHLPTRSMRAYWQPEREDISLDFVSNTMKVKAQ